MKSSDSPGAIPASAHFAVGDTALGNDLKWRITACLRDRIPDLRDIHITVFGNTAALRGEVRSLSEKRMCIECCRHVPGVIRVVDDLVVAEQSTASHRREEELS